MWERTTEEAYSRGEGHDAFTDVKTLDEEGKKSMKLIKCKRKKGKRIEMVED